MDALEILVLGMVGLSVLVFLILDSLHPLREVKETRKQSVGGGGDSAEKRLETSEIVEGEEIQEKEIGNISEDEDWEGVERSELEKRFGEAIVYVDVHGDRIEEEEVKRQLYGLQKVALEGPCYGSQPNALHPSARSKWNAWEKLGNMSAEMAMENYIALLSKAIPEWNINNVNLQSKGEDTSINQDTTISEDITPTPR